MVGDVVGGYLVKEALGSGRSGLLYLAVQASGHRAVVQRRLGDDDVPAFAREVAEVLALSLLPQVELRKSRGGVPVLLAVVDPGAPGSGYTDHTNTGPLPPPRRRRRPTLLVVLLGAGGVGAAISAAGWSGGPTSGSSSPPLEPVVVPTRDVQAPLPVSTSEPPEHPLDDAPPSAIAKQAEPTPAPRPLSPAAPACVPDARWKKDRFADVQDLFSLAGRSEALSSAWDPFLTKLERQVHEAATAVDCAAVEKVLQRYAQRLGRASPP